MSARMLAAVVAAALAASSAAGVEPPAVKSPPAIKAIDPAVRVRFQEWGASGTCVACEGGKSLVVTNNHLFSTRHHPDGGFYDDVYPLRASVECKGSRFAAEAIAGDRDLDVALVVVDGVLTPVPVAEQAPAPGSVVVRYGFGTGAQKARVVPAASGIESPRFQFVVDGVSDSGDSGAGYFDADGKLVAVHCGKADANPRGTPITPVRSFLKRCGAARFPRFASTITVTITEGPPAVKPKDPPKVEMPKPATPPATFAPPVYSSCPGGVCPAPTATRRGLFRR